MNKGCIELPELPHNAVALLLFNAIIMQGKASSAQPLAT